MTALLHASLTQRSQAVSLGMEHGWTEAKLESQQQTQLQGLTKHDITGAILQAGVQSYFALNDVQDRIAQSSANIVQNRMMSFGTFCTYIQPKQMYGLTTAARLTGMMMDIDRMQRQLTDKDNNLDGLRAFVASQGPRQSANEHLIPEALFDDPATTEKEAEAISAVKALQIAAQQGQKIFTITQANIDQVLPQLSHKALVLQDVKDAVAAGKIVTISQSMISYKGWTGAGYILIDPNTGAGAYLIGGGMDGGFLALLTGVAQGAAWTATFAALGIAITTLGPLGIGAAIILFVGILLPIIQIVSVYGREVFSSPNQEACLEIGTILGGALVGIISAFKNSLKSGIVGLLGIVSAAVALRPSGTEKIIDCVSN